MTPNAINKMVLYLGMAIVVFSLTMCKTQKLTVPVDSQVNSSKTKTETGKMLPLIKDKISYLDSLFSAAMQEAENPTPDKINYNLLPIVGNPDLIDTLIEGEKYVKMVSWKSNPTYFPDSGKYNTSKYDVWVTAAPLIQDKCIEYYKTQKDPNMRLRQLLGLQPFTVETFFLEVWVKPTDLFRPCPDNGTEDNHCELNLPNKVTDEYRKWFNNLRAVQYNDCTDTTFHEYGYPWTQLGYTYDWSPDNQSHVGLSEFVITRNTDVYVSGKYATKVYCKSEY